MQADDTSSDPFNLERFVEAQARDYATALDELRSGSKMSHWIWYVFPQLAALGRSATAKRYGIASFEEAQAYLAHPVLGPRLIEAAETALASGVHDPRALFGSPDDLKVRSCLTLFLEVAPGTAPLETALQTFYDGDKDERTLALLADDPGRGGPPGPQEDAAS